MDYYTDSESLKQWDSTFPALNLWNYSLFNRWHLEFNKQTDEIVVIPS